MNASEIMRYVVCHPQTRVVFPGWSREQLELFTLEHVRDDGVAVVIADRVIIGAVFFSPRSTDLMIEAIYADLPAATLAMVRACKRRYPGYKLCARRSGRDVVYQPRHINMLENLVTPSDE